MSFFIGENYESKTEKGNIMTYREIAEKLESDGE